MRSANALYNAWDKCVPNCATAGAVRKFNEKQKN